MKRTTFIMVICALCALLAVVQFAAAPSRIVLGGKAVVMVADAVYMFPQAKDRVVAVGKADQGLGLFLQAIDPGFAAKPSLDRAAGAETYAALKPDLCVFKSSMRSSIEAPLSTLGIPTMFLALETPEDYYRELGLLGAVMGDRERAEGLVAYYRGCVDAVAALVKPVAEKDRPRVLVLQVSGDDWQVPPDSWMQTRLVELSGGRPVWKGANPGSGWAKVGLEQIAVWNPDRIYIVSYSEKSNEVAAKFAADRRVAALLAVKTGWVRGVPQDFYSWDQPDSRWALGLWFFAKRNHPTVFSRVSLVAQARLFFSFAYRMDDATFDKVIRPRLSGDFGE